MFNASEKEKFLRQCGWRFRSNYKPLTAIKNFQAACGIASDGIWGPITQKYANQLIDQRFYISKNFKLSEFACHCNEHYSGCKGIIVTPAIIRLAQAIRDKYFKDGLYLLSAYRCPENNKLAHGASKSEHLKGNAIDILQRISITNAKLAGAKGIGYAKRTRLVTHVDMRVSASEFVDG